MAEGVADRVTFVGSRSRDELKYYYSAADVFVTTPWYEPFGITPLEAMACGTPVVGSNVGGIKFTVRDGETGYLVPAKDPAALAERIAYLYQNPKLLGVLSRQARAPGQRSVHLAAGRGRDVRAVRRRADCSSARTSRGRRPVGADRPGL